MASLKSSSERGFVVKVGKQYRHAPEANTRPNTNITKNPKDKSVIGEPSRQTTSGTSAFGVMSMVMLLLGVQPRAFSLRMLVCTRVI